jgi:hypothetical protein
VIASRFEGATFYWSFPMRKYLSLAITIVALCLSVQIAQAAPKTFVNPKVGSNRLDFCLNWGSGCGEPAATAWCQSKGFNKSIDSEMDADIGNSSPTRLIATGAVCDQPYCDGFTFITCASALAPPPPPPPFPQPPNRFSSSPGSMVFALTGVTRTSRDAGKKPLTHGATMKDLMRPSSSRLHLALARSGKQSRSDQGKSW